MNRKVAAFGMALALGSFGAAGAFATPKEAADELNELLRGELSAVETYEQALEKVGKDPDAQPLRDSLSNHRQAADSIKRQIVQLGGTPTDDSGAWGAWAKTVTGSAKVLGDSAALKALKEGEEHGIKEYNEVLEEESVPAAFKTEIRTERIPKQREHIAALDKMMENRS